MNFRYPLGEILATALMKGAHTYNGFFSRLRLTMDISKKKDEKSLKKLLISLLKNSRKHQLVYFETSGTNSIRFFVSCPHKGFLVVKFVIWAVLMKFMC